MGKISDDDIVSVIKTAVIPIIEQMEQAFNEGNFMQADEIRYKEDMPALGLNWIRLGLYDVLYDPKSKTIYTPNTNASVKVGEGGIAVSDELRYNENHDDRGRFTFGSVGGSSEDGVDKTEKDGIIESEKFNPLPTSKAVPRMREMSDKWIKNLTPEEYCSLSKHTKNSGDADDNKFYNRLNSALRNGAPLDKGLKLHSDNISSAINKFELSDDIICYRSTKNNFFSKYKIYSRGRILSKLFYE
jgi:hypothetical protein